MRSHIGIQRNKQADNLASAATDPANVLKNMQSVMRALLARADSGEDE